MAHYRKFTHVKQSYQFFRAKKIKLVLKNENSIKACG